MTFSIIMAAYNRKDILVKAIEKIMEMDYPKANYEIIVGDNNSTDGTPQKMKEFSVKNKTKMNLKYLIEKRKGNIYARHSAVKHATGKYLVFCDDDCFVEKNWLSEIERVFNKFPQIGLLGTRIEILWNKTPPSWIKKYQSYLGEISGSEGVTIKETGLLVNSGSMAIPRELFKTIKGTNPEQVDDFYVGDGETGLCKKLHRLKIPIAFTNDTFVCHYQTVEKNASESDIARRSYNNGISVAYNESVILKKDTLDETIEYERQVKKERVIKFWKYLTKDSRRKLSFDLNFIRGKIEYLNALKSNTALIKSMSLNDWIYDEKYCAPELAEQINLNS